LSRHTRTKPVVTRSHASSMSLHITCRAVEQRSNLTFAAGPGDAQWVGAVLSSALGSGLTSQRVPATDLRTAPGYHRPTG